MSKSSNENTNGISKDLQQVNELKVLNDNINNVVKGSPYRKRIATKQLDQIEATQNLFKDFDLKSPRKRTNENLIESPSKRAKEQNKSIDETHSKNSSITDSPKPRVSNFSLTKDTLSSTPKSKHKPNFQNLCQKNEKDEKIERNLSKSWIDIIDELEEQNKDLKEYVKKVCERYKFKEEDLLKKLETDTEILRKRQKQINYGKLTDEYKAYSVQVIRKQRKQFDPKTPNKYRKCSRRQYDGMIKKWRKQLHIWCDNPENLKDAKFDEDDINDGTTDSDTKFFLDEFTITTTNSSSEETNSENL